MDALTAAECTHKVVTAQGRTVPASETPWMPAGETCVHAVDFGTAVTFADLPEGILLVLREDNAAKRGDVPTRVDGPLPTLVVCLAGRGNGDV